MADLFWLTRAQIRRITPYFPLPHGVPRVDDQRVVVASCTSSARAALA